MLGEAVSKERFYQLLEAAVTDHKDHEKPAVRIRDANMDIVGSCRGYV